MAGGGTPLPSTIPVPGQGPWGNIPLGGRKKWAFASQTHEMRLYFKNTRDGTLPSGTPKLKESGIIMDIRHPFYVESKEKIQRHLQNGKRLVDL